MASVAHNGDLNLRVIGHFCLFTVLIGSHCNLEASRHCLEVIIGADITILQTRPHWVNIEEGVLPVLDVCARVSVQGLVALIANGWQV